MVAPLAVNVVFVPEHIAGAAGLTVTTGTGVTVTVTVLVPVQPPVVPVTVYVVVVVGLAVGLAILVALNPVAGLQLYVVAPLAVNVVLEPAQMVGATGVTVTVGTGFTVTVTVLVLEQLPVVPVTV